MPTHTASTKTAGENADTAGTKTIGGPTHTANNGNSKPPAHHSTSTSSNAGAIAGGVVGGVAGLTLIVLVIFILLRLRRKKRGELASPTMPAMSGVWDLKRPLRGNDASRALTAGNVSGGKEGGLQGSAGASYDREARPAELEDTEAGLGLELMAERGPIHEMPEVTTPRGG